MDKEDFFNRCADILNTEHKYVDLKPRKRVDRTTGQIIQTDSAYSRWGPRIPGNGRFPGFGIIRVYSSQMIHVLLTKPKKVNKILNSYDEVLTLLKDIVVDSD